MINITKFVLYILGLFIADFVFICYPFISTQLPDKENKVSTEMQYSALLKLSKLYVFNSLIYMEKELALKLFHHIDKVQTRTKCFCA